MRKCRMGTAKNFTLLLLLYLTQSKSQGMKQLMAGGGVALIGMTLVPLLSGLFG
ncbi:Maff2 family protein [Blautia faecis]|uniref:Maff2 family mobile element protein n=1 Tax=Blautia faecis TaxID=871665 RepID=UPI0028A410D9|nr:Maff2 family protein [Blautia faecis]MDT4369674.1 Maff2 family protein [Blautia faecis]